MALRDDIAWEDSLMRIRRSAVNMLNHPIMSGDMIMLSFVYLYQHSSSCTEMNINTKGYQAYYDAAQYALFCWFNS